MNKPFFKIHKDIRPKSMTELSNNGFKRDESLDFEQYIEKLSEYKFICILNFYINQIT